MLCLATTHCPADVKDTETTLVQSPTSTLAHLLVGHRLLAWSPAVSCTSPDLRLHPQNEEKAEEVVRGLSPGRSRGQSSSPSGSGLLRQRCASHASPPDVYISRSGSLRHGGMETLSSLMEGPDPNASECGGDTPIFLLITKGLDDDREDLSGDEGGESRDVREIRSSIGLDKTLDNEEEEDEYYRLAKGKGKARNCFRKDPRADEIAAQVRLKEDVVEAAKYEPNFFNTEVSGEKHENKETSDDCSKLRPILKRKGVGEGRSKRRVRFDPSFVDESEDALERGPVFSGASSTEDTKEQDSGSLFDENKPKVPDHLINPSKYTLQQFRFMCCVDPGSHALVTGDGSTAGNGGTGVPHSSASRLGKNQPEEEEIQQRK
nr:uncharacterized protein LOC109176041 [Ipomoea batatas]